MIIVRIVSDIMIVISWLAELAIGDVSLNFLTYITSSNVFDYVNAPLTRRSFAITSYSTTVNELFTVNTLGILSVLLLITYVHAQRNSGVMSG